MKRFTWETANPVERAIWVRDNLKQFDRDKVRELFRLTEEGLQAIEDGAAWRQDYEQAAYGENI